MTEPYLSSDPMTGDTTQLDQTDRVMDLLAAGVPLTLLLDSHEVYDREPGSADWLTVSVA
jgi:hypothetical protein